MGKSEAVAFYAPLKSPRSPVPSGDRRFARLLIRALGAAGFAPALASEAKSRNADGDPARQRRIETRAGRAADRLTESYRIAGAPALWLTYHSYYKAPDLLGPVLSERFGLPYVLVEASHASARSEGAHARGHRQAAAALRRADLILQPNPKDLSGVESLLGLDAPQHLFPPFLEIPAPADRAAARAQWAEALGLEPDPVRPWLLAAGMMRAGAKLRSYRILAAAWRRLKTPEAVLILAGDGPARADVEAAFAGGPAPIFAGRLRAGALASLMAASDLYLWPAIGEAFGMAVLEAQAAGLPVICGDRPGTRAMIRDGDTGMLTPEGDAGAMAAAAAALLAGPERRRTMGHAARDHVRAVHSLDTAAERLRGHLTPLLRAPAS
jgi:hypothetical protein